MFTYEIDYLDLNQQQIASLKDQLEKPLINYVGILELIKFDKDHIESLKIFAESVINLEKQYKFNIIYYDTEDLDFGTFSTKELYDITMSGCSDEKDEKNIEKTIDSIDDPNVEDNNNKCSIPAPVVVSINDNLNLRNEKVNETPSQISDDVFQEVEDNNKPTIPAPVVVSINDNLNLKNEKVNETPIQTSDDVFKDDIFNFEEYDKNFITYHFDEMMRISDELSKEEEPLFLEQEFYLDTIEFEQKIFNTKYHNIMHRTTSTKLLDPYKYKYIDAKYDKLGNLRQEAKVVKLKAYNDLPYIAFTIGVRLSSNTKELKKVTTLISNYLDIKMSTIKTNLVNLRHFLKTGNTKKVPARLVHIYKLFSLVDIDKLLDILHNYKHYANVEFAFYNLLNDSSLKNKLYDLE